ncbi:hypothetical protein AN7786.2 [Aspergillus nidulans FGSC A4]|uniref:Uncharacterized protein n=1 Tax=Emericella nidulans (strain FGSC A4 / ATCC 38163 / CBS 112.46 / NRRL 194 / M139) TaxID=227321 RepID=Q5AV94_EMENI|nr:hypothetical protein [Aspergillus nidulans FGSC A4]EAA61574.1 hypothetical protein AN7786.2 [Aspergillus nidulans FGSC A4]CBF80104.1 TPA: conserved hypothetical protein [Aspergillus nidulans FGSC A4]|eukprot:XP_681055.1 hypothetical protein AN7786.2 [Aspergillus nidulans FGSC A4]
MAESIPVILCGRRVEVGKPVSEVLRPEYEVIHFIASPEAVHAELPLLLSGQDPQPAVTSPNDVGTHDYSRPPRAVVFGRGYAPEFVQQLKERYQSYCPEPVAWVMGDPATAPTDPPPPGYAEATANTIKNVLATWREQGERDAFLVY